MGAQQSVVLSSYEDVLTSINHPGTALLMNTLAVPNQECLIARTLPALQEELSLNGLLDRGETGTKIIIYGRNCVDKTPYRKIEQLVRLGFSNITVYPGGMLEWLLLQDAFGEKTFVTTTKCADIMTFGPAASVS